MSIRVRRLLTILPLLVLLSACAAGANSLAGGQASQAGFWLGLWHGLIFPITFVVSLFTDTINVYEVRNTGSWYDFGFFLGVACAFSGGGHASGSTRVRRRRASS